MRKKERKQTKSKVRNVIQIKTKCKVRNATQTKRQNNIQVNDQLMVRRSNKGRTATFKKQQFTLREGTNIEK